MSWDSIESRLRDLARRAGLRDVPPAAMVAVVALAVVAIVWGAWRWWPRASAAPAGASAAPAHASTFATGTPASTGASGAASLPTSALVLVHVVGAVRHPGVYELPAGSRAIDAVDAAGGLLADAAPEAVNLARPVADGEQIAVPDKDDVAGAGAPAGAMPAEVGAATPPGGQAPPAGAAVDLNTADAALLDTLPGVGPSTASKIVADREANGPYASVEDLSRVSGIGPKKLEQLKGVACVR